MNCEEIETKLKKFETDYNNNVSMFNKFSEVGNITCDFYNTNTNGVDYHITIKLYMIVYHTFEKFIDIGTKILYTNFKYNLSCPKT